MVAKNVIIKVTCKLMTMKLKMTVMVMMRVATKMNHCFLFDMIISCIDHCIVVFFVSMTMPSVLQFFPSLQICVYCVWFIWSEDLSVPFLENLSRTLPLLYTFFPYKPVPMSIYPLEFDVIKLEQVL